MPSPSIPLTQTNSVHIETPFSTHRSWQVSFTPRGDRKYAAGMDYLVASSPDFLDLGCRQTGVTGPSILSRRMNARRHLVGTSLPGCPDSPRKFTIGGFSPLPSISASPICTPTTSNSPEFRSEEYLIQDYTTAPSSPTALSLRVSPPTWISTPPTPPPKMVRRSVTVTCSTRRTSPLLPSASFPASSPPHEFGYFMKRCNSVPLMPQRLSSSHSHQPYSHDSLVDVTTFPGTFVPATRDATTMKPPLPHRSKPLFHIPNDACTDTEESSHRLTASPEQMNEDLSIEGSWSDNDSDESRHSEKAKDDLRKYHALKELLDTEVGYLLDLRALVTVYLRILPTLICRPPPSTPFARASSSFTSTTWAHSYAHIHPATVSLSSAGLSDSASLSLSSSQTRELPKISPRYLFTNHEVEVLTRNAEEILQLHEQFVRELRIEMSPLGFPMDAYHRSGDSAEDTKGEAMQNTDAAIRVVSTKFAVESSRFASYQTFCAGHPEALDLVRKVSSQHPLEWDAFEQRCSSLVSELELCTGAVSDRSETIVPEEVNPTHAPVVSAIAQYKERSRSASMSSIEGAVRTLRSRASNLPQRDVLVFPTEGLSREKSGPRLAFIDYMIKPVQRICKYPLILEQLKPSKSLRALFSPHLRSDVVVVVESATQAMRHVASAVDEARHRQDVAIQSALIASRISLASPALSQMSSIYTAFQTLTQPFISSLGTCLLAGSLDVIHDHAGKPYGSHITAKYMGAFLYLGGYLILVKVLKGKVYEPKHWFSLADFEVCDVDEVDAMLACSFRLSSKDHRFELAPACQREKEAWLNYIRESRNHIPSWINEPTSSLRFDCKGELIPSTLDDGPFELVNALPTIQSIPELANNSTDRGLDLLFTTVETEVKQRKSPRQEFAWRQEPDPPSRRSSTASVKGIFSPMTSDSETIVIRRSSASARSRVDQGLQDVISQLCLTARSYASVKDEELFQAPKATRSGFVRSQSGLSMAGMAKSRLTRHESVRVLRRKSLIDKPDLPSSKKSSSSGQSTTSRKQPQALNITLMSDSDHRSSVSNSLSSGLPSPFSPTFTTPSAQFGSSPKSSRSSFFGYNHSHRSTEGKSPMKSSRSLVTGVMELFQSRSSSPISLGSSRASSNGKNPSKRRAPSSIRRWAKGSIHRRTRSAPDVPEEPITLPDIQKLPALDFGASITLTTSPTSYVPPQTMGKTSRLQSLVSASGHYPVEPDHGTSKHMSILHRLKA